MKSLIKYSFSLLFVSLFLVSCEDPVDLDLGPAKEQIVIDALIDNTTDTQYIYITKSVAYLQKGITPGYKMDTVGILDTATFTFHAFQYKGNGVYYFVPPSANTFQADRDYQLIAKDGANTYVSQSRLNSATAIDSVTYKYEADGLFGGNQGRYVTLWAKDKVGTGDFYWLRLYRNDSIQSRAADINLSIDNSVTQGGNGDGDLFIVPIRQNFTSRPWNVGEKVEIEILTITPEMYFYLNLLRTQLQNVGLFAVPPSNVPSNIVCINDPDKKVLGFFCMAGKAKSPTIIIQ